MESLLNRLDKKPFIYDYNYSKEWLKLQNDKSISDGDLRPDFMKIGVDSYILQKKLFCLQNSGAAAIKHLDMKESLSHSHDFFELVYILSGTVTQTINNEVVKLNRGSLCLFNKEVIHSIKKLDANSQVFLIAIDEKLFDLNFFNSTYEDSLYSNYIYNSLYKIKNSSKYLITDNINEEEVGVLSLICKELSEKQQLYKEVIRNYLPLLFINLYRFGSSKKMATQLHPTREQVLVSIIYNYLKSNYKNATLSSTAEELYMHPSYTSRLIKELTGSTFTELVHLIKMERAAQMLSHTDITIDMIAFDIGYENPNYFYRLFKDHYGLTPNAYRCKLKGNIM